MDKITHVLLDTSYLREIGFSHPDFRKLLQHSREGRIKLLVPHVAWEERRTQFAETAVGNVRKVRKEYDNLVAQLPNNFVLQHLPTPDLKIWTKEEIDTKSKEAMSAFAEENKIEVIPLAPDHAERAWSRYFDVGPPFKQDQPRENRRKDIPDSWIVEAALDAREKYQNLVALCMDGGLSEALEGIRVRVYKDTKEVLDGIEVGVGERVPEARKEQAAADLLAQALLGAGEQFREAEQKVLGFVGYLGDVPKQKLIQLLNQAGISEQIAVNAAERLALSKLIVDTGSHYLVGDEVASEAAAKSVELEIIRLLKAQGIAS